MNRFIAILMFIVVGIGGGFILLFLYIALRAMGIV